MFASQRRGLTAKIIVLALFAATLIGCSASTWGPEASTVRPRRMPAKYRAKTETQQEKPIEATEDYRERHPSMWRRKLRATYS